MRNRAKCKLCDSVIESYHSTDYVSCKCDEISVYGGNSLRCGAKDFKNFMRVDDEGNEISVKIAESDEIDEKLLTVDKVDKKALLGMLEALIKSIENLPSHAMGEAVTHYDLLTVLQLMNNIFKS